MVVGHWEDCCGTSSRPPREVMSGQQARRIDQPRVDDSTANRVMSNAPAELHEMPEAMLKAPGSEYDDLLLGLEADDLNDFGGLGDFDEDMDQGLSEGQALRDPLVDAGPATVQTPLSFTTAKGNAIAPPSKAALEKATRLFQEIDTQAEEPAMDPDRATWPAPSKRRRVEPDDADGLPDEPAPDFTMSHSAGFINGRGKAVPPPSEAALQKALAIISAVENEEICTTEAIAPAAAALSTSGFTTGGGNAIAAPSSSALDRVKHLFADADSATAGLNGPSAIVTPVRPAARPDTPTAAPIPDDARRKALAILGEDDAGPTSSSSVMLPPPASRPFVPLVTATATPRPVHNAPLASSSTPFRTPLRQTTNTFAQTPTMPSPSVSRKGSPKPIEIKSNIITPRRVGMGLTPMSSRGRAKKTFVTPFKNGPRVSGSPLKPGNVPRTSFLPSSTLQLESKQGIWSKPVFDLTRPPDRKNDKQAFLHPQYNSHRELKEMGLPDEIWRLDLSNGLLYQFIAEDATVLNHAHALVVLKGDGCTLATAKWVDNHWPLILWKLAGQVQAKPALFDEKWNWGEVIAQLKYRYEREYGHAQRPIIRRIQEHDSSASLPMVLCVAAIRWVQVPTEDEQDPLPPRSYLELTDGWYKIVAELDECLQRAVTKGRIVPGRKLAISGAKLDSGAEGAEVLEAFDKSRLILSGNSTSLARWHEKLGQQPHPFVAGLSSLSVDGGQIVLMDIIIDRLYPIAFINGQKGNREGPWSEEEERSRADQWKERYEAESTAWRETMRKRLEGVEDLVESLVSAAQDVSESVSTTPPDSLERDFDEILSAPNATARIRQLSPSHVVHLASYARDRMQQEFAEGQAEIDAELQTACPPRDVRDFCMARISDAREGVKDAARAGMLNIWDVRSLGEGVLKEGGRYLVSNLMPGRQGDWSVPKEGGSLKEIYLHTRRDTRWKEVEHVA